MTRRAKQSENAFLSVYKALAEAPDPFPLLDAAVDQTARASEARLLESELSRERELVKDLRSELSEALNVEKEKKKLQEKVDKFETKVSRQTSVSASPETVRIDGRHDCRKGGAEGSRAQRYLR